ncbi:MAG: hypothetical protein AAB303_06435 [Chloroflexota bacterium]
MTWWAIIAAAALYLLFRIEQTTSWFVNRFLLAPAIPLPVKAVVLLTMDGMVMGAWIWWKLRTGRHRTSGHRA